MKFREYNNFSAISFDVDGISYIYDSFSNQLLKVAPVIVDIIDDTFAISREEIIAKYKDKYSEDVISGGLKNISDAQEKQMFSANLLSPDYLSPQRKVQWRK